MKEPCNITQVVPVTRFWDGLWGDAAFSFLQNRSRIFKIVSLVLLDAVLLVCVAFVAYMLRMSEITLPPHDILSLVLLGPLLNIASAGLFGVYLSITRLRIHGSDSSIILSQIPVVVVWSLFVFLIGRNGFPRSLIAIYAIFAPTAMIYSRRLVAAIVGNRALFVSRQSGIGTVIVGLVPAARNYSPASRGAATTDLPLSWRPTQDSSVVDSSEKKWSP